MRIELHIGCKRFNHLWHLCHPLKCKWITKLKKTLAGKASTSVKESAQINRFQWTPCLPGPLYLFEPRKDYPIPQKLTLTSVVECWNLCIMHLWRNMQIRAILVLCLSMLILHSHPANSQWVDFFIKEKSYFHTRVHSNRLTSCVASPLKKWTVKLNSDCLFFMVFL